MTEEQKAAYLDALAREKDGYVARIKALKESKQDPLDEKALQARVKAVETEIARVKRQKPPKDDDDDSSGDGAEAEAAEA